MGIHVTRTILETLSAGLLQKTIIMKVKGDVIESVARTCQDLFGLSSHGFLADVRSIS